MFELFPQNKKKIKNAFFFYGYFIITVQHYFLFIHNQKLSLLHLSNPDFLNFHNLLIVDNLFQF